MLAAGQGPSLPDLEGMLRRLTGQRDTAQMAAAEAQAKLATCEAQVQCLQQQLASAGGHCENQERTCEPFPWPTPLPTETTEVPPATCVVVPGAPGGVAGGVTASAELAAVQADLAAERQQSQQLQAALHALTSDMQKLQLQQQQQQQLVIVPANSPNGINGSGHALADVTNHSQRQDAQWLARQLSRVRFRLQQLAAENERLMDLSNGLRAERNRLAAAAAGQQAADGWSGGNSSKKVQGPLQPVPQATPLYEPSIVMIPPGPWPLLTLPAAGRLFASAQPATSSPQQMDTKVSSSAQQTAGLCGASNPAPVQETGAQHAARAAAGFGAKAEPVAVVGTTIPEAGRVPPGYPGGSSASRGGAAGRRRLPLLHQRERQQQREQQQQDHAKAPSPPRVRNYNITSP